MSTSKITRCRLWLALLFTGPALLLPATVRADEPEISVTAPGELASGSAVVVASQYNPSPASTSRTFTIRNTGTASLTGVAASLTGDGGFSVTTAPAATVPPGGTTSLILRFTPAGTAAVSATLRIASNDADENPFTLTLTGSGTVTGPFVVQDAAGEVQPSAAMLNFGAMPAGATADRTFTVTNISSGLRTGISLGNPTASQFAVVSAPTSSLAGYASTQFTLRFHATAGAVGATVRLSYEAPTPGGPIDSTVLVLNLSGTWIGPEISVEQTPGVSLTDGAARVSFGNVPPGSSATRTFTIRNTGNADLTGLLAAVNGPQAAEYTVTAVPAVSVPADGSTEVTITFTPVAAGPRTAALHLASNDADESPFDISLVAPGAEIAISGPGGVLTSRNAVDFGAVVVGAEASLTFTIANPGNDTLTEIVATLSGDGVADFAATSSPAASVAPGGSTSFTLRFRPTAGGNLTALLRVTSSDADENPFDLTLTGTGAAALNGPEIAVFAGAGTAAAAEITDNAATFDFPATVQSHRSEPLTFTIKNTGLTPLTGIGAGVSGAGQGVFYMLNEVPGGTLAPNATGRFTLSFTPLVPGSHTALLTFSSNDADENPFRIHVRTTCIAPEISMEGPAGTPLETGVVVAWGRAANGQVTVPAAAQSGVTALAVGDYHTVALKLDGGVLAWGLNEHGQTAVPAAAQSAVKAIAGGGSHTVALKADGSVIAWGRNDDGQSSVPTVAQSGVSAIAAGAYHSVALKNDGSVRAWGYSLWGQTTVPFTMTRATAVAAGAYHTVALWSDGSVSAWGLNAYGQIAVPAAAQSGVVAIAAGAFHTLALKNTGGVIAWGDNEAGQRIVPVAAQSGVVAIAAGSFHNVVLKNDGSVITWGWNDDGQTTVPPGLANVKAIAAGVAHTAVLRDAAVSFGVQTVSSTGAAQTFTIRNSGGAPLNITSVSVTGGHASDFTVNQSAMLSSVPALTGATTFTVTFRPGVAGIRQTTLRVRSHDLDEGTQDILLTGTGALAQSYDSWIAAALPAGATAAELAGTYDYDGDGVANVLEFAANLDPRSADRRSLTPGTGLSGLPVPVVQETPAGPRLTLEFLRRKAGSQPGISYQAVCSGELSTWEPGGNEVITSIDETWERVVATDPAPAGAARRFARLAVSVLP